MLYFDVPTIGVDVGRFAETILEDAGKTIGRILPRACLVDDSIGVTSQPMVFPFRLRKLKRSVFCHR